MAECKISDISTSLCETIVWRYNCLPQGHQYLHCISNNFAWSHWYAIKFTNNKLSAHFFFIIPNINYTIHKQAILNVGADFYYFYLLIINYKFSEWYLRTYILTYKWNQSYGISNANIVRVTVVLNSHDKKKKKKRNGFLEDPAVTMCVSSFLS